MKRSDGFYWSTQESFSLPVRARQELAKYQKIRPCNVKLCDVIIAVVKSIIFSLKGK